MSTYDNDDISFEDIETLLNSHLDDFSDELGRLYNEIERYAETADVMRGADREDDAEYFEKLAVERYKAFTDAIQLRKEKEDDDYEFDYDE